MLALLFKKDVVKTKLEGSLKTFVGIYIYICIYVRVYIYIYDVKNMSENQDIDRIL